MPSSRGAPVWQVNMVNLNFYMADTPLWYASPVGPSVELKLSYNAQTSLSGAFGRKWQLNYGSYLYRAVDDFGVFAGIMVVMPDGKQQLYVPDGSGYKAPYYGFNTLTELTESRFELRFPDGKTYVYDIPPGTTAVSFLTEIRDAYGQKLSLGHDENGRLTTITDALGKATALSYNNDGLVVQAADPFGRTASFEYDADGNLAKITDMGGYWTSFAYELYSGTDYYLAALTNAAGAWGFDFEPEDGLDNGGVAYPAPGAAMGDVARITITNPLGGREEYFRTSSSAWHVSPGNYLPYEDPSTNNSADSVSKTLYTFVLTTGKRGEVGSVESPEGNILDYSYDDNGNMTGLSNGLAYFSYGYNSLGKIISIANQMDLYQTVTNLTYAENGVDLTGIAISSTAGELGTIQIGYNHAHEIISYTNRLGNQKTVTYNGYGQIESATDPLGATTTYSYDADHRLSLIARNDQTLRSYTYDTVGRVKSLTDESGMTRIYDYNGLDEITKITYPDDRYASRAYSTAIPRLVTGMTDRGGKTTQYVYDAAGNLTRIVNPSGGIAAFAYDANGNRTQLTDPKGQVTQFAYDKDNRLVRKTFADGTMVSYTHDAAGRLASTTGARNLSVFYNFDSKDSLVGISYSMDMTHPENNTYPVMFTYDPYRRRTAMIDESGTTDYGYDADSRVTSVDGPLVNDTLTLQYDGKGRRTGYSLQQGQSVSYGYDALDRLTSIQGSAGLFSYTYSGAGPQVRKLTRPNGSYTDYEYDTLNRLILVVHRKSSGEVISQYGYAYNAQDRRAGETIIDGAPVASVVSQTTTYSHNNVNELLGSTNPAKTFSYDADGNTVQWESPDGKTLAGVYDIANRLKSAGYEITAGMTYESYQITYEYRGDGMMSQKEEEYAKIINYPNYENYKNLVNYVGYGLLPLQERDKSNIVLREYTWGIDAGGGIGGLLSMKQGGEHYFYLYDGKGNVTAALDAAQNVAAAYAYDVFGNLLSKSGTLEQPYRFSTKQYDDKTGLSYFGYRFYAPASGRWMTRDPLGEVASPNLYAFVKNDPINRYDPTGLEDGFCGPGEEPVETRVDPDNDGPYTTWTCMPEKSAWQKMLDWLDSLQTNKEPGADRALAHQCRIMAGDKPGPGWTGPEN